MEQIAINERHLVSSCLTHSLANHEYRECVKKIRDLYLWFAPGSTEDDIYKRLHRHVCTRLDILTDQHTNHCIGFSVHHTEVFDGHRVMFRGGTVVQDRSKGLYKRMMQQGIELEQPSFLAAMTQNPRVYETMRSFSPRSLAYPSADSSTPEQVRRIAQHLCKAPGLDPVSLHVPDVYDSIRKEQDFKTARDPVVEQMFASLGENDGLFVVAALQA